MVSHLLPLNVETWMHSTITTASDSTAEIFPWKENEYWKWGVQYVSYFSDSLMVKQ